MWFILNSCSKDELTENQISKNDYGQISRTRAAGFHWICNMCGHWNGGWTDRCTDCIDGRYSPSHSDKIIKKFLTDIRSVPTAGGGPGGLPPEYINKETQIQLPDLSITINPPVQWYNDSPAIGYYNALKTIYYHSNSAYAEGVDFAWHRTVRVFNPSNISSADMSKIESIHARFMIFRAPDLVGSKGSGIKAGTKAAIEALNASR